MAKKKKFEFNKHTTQNVKQINVFSQCNKKKETIELIIIMKNVNKKNENVNE